MKKCGGTYTIDDAMTEAMEDSKGKSPEEKLKAMAEAASEFPSIVMDIVPIEHIDNWMRDEVRKAVSKWCNKRDCKVEDCEWGDIKWEVLEKHKSPLSTETAEYWFVMAKIKEFSCKCKKKKVVIKKS